MTRKEEIKLAAYCRYCTSISETTNMQCQCFDEGARWSDKTMIDKTCEWLEKNASNYQNWEYNEFHQCVEYDGSYDIEKMIKDFREAMEE